MKQLKVRLEKGSYSTTIVIGGWATYPVRGPFHYHRAIKMCDECQLKAAIILAKERIKDDSNIEIFN